MASERSLGWIREGKSGGLKGTPSGSVAVQRQVATPQQTAGGFCDDFRPVVVPFRNPALNLTNAPRHDSRHSGPDCLAVHAPERKGACVKRVLRRTTGHIVGSFPVRISFTPAYRLSAVSAANSLQNGQNSLAQPRQDLPPIVHTRCRVSPWTVAVFHRDIRGLGVRSHSRSDFQITPVAGIIRPPQRKGFPVTPYWRTL